MNVYIKSSLWVLIFFVNTLIYASKLPEWEIVPAQSEITFTGTQNGAPVTGRFKKFTGQIFADPSNYKTGSIDITIDMNSIAAPFDDIVTTLASPDWFNVKAFPNAEFKASKFNQLDDKTYEAEGILTIRDKSAPVTLKFVVDQISNDQALVEGSSTIKRSTFRVGQGEWESTDEIQNEVIVRFKITATRKK
ncbi:TPA: YceI family protein [Legionella pneumophila]|nr:YceI family protein [Legionella pneumophila]